MKDSGVEWIGEIPVDWDVVRFRYFINAYKAGPFGSSLKMDGLRSNGNILIYTPEHIANKSTDSEKNLYLPDEREEEMSQFFVEEGDILFPIVGSLGRAMVVDCDMPKGIINQRVAKFKIDERIVEREFFLWLFAKSDFFETYIDLSCRGSFIVNLTKSIINDMPCVIPPKLEQQKIVSYLDDKCAKIDAIIARQKEIIEKLKEYKLSIITEVVTKGVNSEVEMKESGIDICKEIPINWKTSQIRHLFQLRDEKNYKPLEEVQLLSLYTDLGVFPHGEQEERGNKAVKAEGYKVVYDGDIVVNIILAWMGAIGRSAYNGVTSPAYDIYKPLTGVCSEYYHYMFRTKAFSGECYKYGRGIMAMRWRTYSSEFKSIKVPVPPYEEQKTIAKYLDIKCSMLDKTIGDRRSAIEKLQAYKKSLIYEVVTGKKEV
ncbi:restriction endonuclease subunit S [Blautia massiliensis (ex Liu et al. 2021)]|uniref:restriction endonuclease subunit S n=1 Tax=Blautia massiliensis (ex Liu et al. 2021) TaxID=3062492 RepID=UPI003F8BE4DE